MKLRKLLIGSSIVMGLSAFTACQDNNRQNEAEGENMEMQDETQVRSANQTGEGQNNNVRLAVRGTPELSTFALRMDAAQVAQSLEDEEGPYTIFAPNNAAYSYMYREHGEDALLNIDNDQEIQYLIAEGKFTTDSLRSGIQENNGTFTIPTLQGEHLIVSMQNDSIFLRGRAGSGASIIQSDIDATNGVVHIINTVILPGDIETNVRLNDQ